MYFLYLKPIIKVLSEKIQKTAAMLSDGSTMEICFARVITIDTGAGLGICDGLQFALKGNPSLTLHLINIEVV